MISNIFAIAMLAAGGAPAAPAAEAPAAPAAEEAAMAPAALPDVHDLKPAQLPLVALPLDLTQKSDPIWVKGNRPSENVIARVTLRPVEAAVVEGSIGLGYEGATVLPMALVGPASDFATLRDAQGAEDKVYCTAGKGADSGRLVCLQDRDGDGRFEQRARALAESGNKVEQLSVLGKMEPLDKPIPYRPARANELPKVAASFLNCDKDHDRPRYSFAAADGSGRLTRDELAELAAKSGGAFTVAQLERMQLSMIARGGGSVCVAGEPVERGDPLYPADLADGAVAARLGELVISVGPKNAGAPVRLIGLREPERLYRLNHGAVVPLAETMTKMQTALAVKHKFDKPVLVTTDAVRVFEGERSAGQALLQVGFAHGYMGVLTADTKIRTLLTSRSLPKGTVLYGIPMSSRVVMTVRGIPAAPTPSDIADPEDTHLVWCVPVEDEGKWSATCLPRDGGRYTLLKGQSPAFEVRSLSYSVNTSTNDGDPPVVEQVGDFGKPLSYRFALKAAASQQIIVVQQTMLGDTVVHSREHQIPRVMGGSSALMFGTGGLLFTDGSAFGTIKVKQIGEFRPGVDAQVRSGLVSRDASKPIPAPPAPPQTPL